MCPAAICRSVKQCCSRLGGLIPSTEMQEMTWMYAGEYKKQDIPLASMPRRWYGTTAEIPLRLIGNNKKDMVKQKLCWKVNGLKNTMGLATLRGQAGFMATD